MLLLLVPHSQHQSETNLESGSVFTIAETTIIDPNGSSFTALLEPVTDATGGVSTLTVTVDAIAGGVVEPIITTIAPPPVTTNANSGELLPPPTSLVTSTASDGSVGTVPAPVPVEGGSGGRGGGGSGGGGGGGGSGDPKDPDDNTSECATQTATFCVDTCSMVSGSLSCSATCTATSTGYDLTKVTTTIT